MEKPSTYGTSTHYLSQSGESYFDYQNTHGPLRGTINARKFAPHIETDGTILDFGCGGGHLLKALSPKASIGVEINPAAAAVARSMGLEVFADISEVPDGAADQCVSNHALEHVPYPIQALREIRRVLKPSGRLVLVVPIDDWRDQPMYDPSDINHHLHTWNPLLLGNSLAEAGFKVNAEDIRILSHAWPPMWSKLFQLSPRAFDSICGIYSRIRHRRQIVAIAHNTD